MHATWYWQAGLENKSIVIINCLLACYVPKAYVTSRDIVKTIYLETLTIWNGGRSRLIAGRVILHANDDKMTTILYTCFIIGVMRWYMYGSLIKAVRLRITFSPFEQGDKSLWVYHSDLLVFCTTHVHTYVIVALFLPRCNARIFTYDLLCINRSKAISTPDVNISTDDGVHDVISGTTVSAINNPTFCYYLYFMSSLRTWTLVYKTFCFI